MRRFELRRFDDPSGISGVGIVAQGCQFEDGTVVIRWLGPTPSTSVWPCIEDALAVHGHGGKTVAQFIDRQPGFTLTGRAVPPSRAVPPNGSHRYDN
jgi:hypothetical protein